MAPNRVALIRGINVGKNKRVAMADLRALATELGYGEVATLLNSGNLVFRSDEEPAEAAARLEEALVARTGVKARILVLKAAELAEMLDRNPLAERVNDPTRFLVAVLAGPADAEKLRPMAETDWGEDAFALGGRVAYAWCPNGLLQSPLFDKLDKTLKNGVTTRNLATMVKIRALLEA